MLWNALISVVAESLYASYEDPANLAQHKDWKHGEVASLALTKGNSIHLPVP